MDKPQKVVGFLFVRFFLGLMADICVYLKNLMVFIAENKISKFNLLLIFIFIILQWLNGG